MLQTQELQGKECHDFCIILCLGSTRCHERGQRSSQFNKICSSIMSGWLATNWSLVEVGWCSRTRDLSLGVNPAQNGFRKRKHAFCSGPVRAQTVTTQKYCWMTFQEQFNTRPSTSVSELKQYSMKNGQNPSWTMWFGVWFRAAWKRCLKSLLPMVWLANNSKGLHPLLSRKCNEGV